ncbi:MAG TPA: FAD-binding oxidoreductase [Fimbriimonadaceae bacterium]|nr:FAD-binding oxidoreductase [Fimbriimonadaceae bacterium]HRJ97879.1 FAD-binding oxidoreductase [Fimbriimonadaceae bacterium]
MQTASDFSQELAQLAQVVTGTVYACDSPGYEDSCAAWNRAIDHRPSVVVEAESAEDVQKAVRFATRHRLPITTQTTGHGQPQIAAGGLLVQMKRLNRVVVDSANQTASVGGGAQWSDVIAAAYPAGLAPLSGSSPGVGVVGYLLGGGYGLMLRTYGLTVDQLRRAKVVLADGSLVVASESENPDLFYALRGGGGAFGIVVELEIGLVPHAEVFAGSVAFDASNGAEIFKTWMAWTKTLPDEITSGIFVITFPPVPFVPEFLHGRSLVFVTACSTLSPEESELLLAPIRSRPGAELDSFRMMPYTESGSIYNEPVDPLPLVGRGAMLTDLDEAAVEALFHAIGPIPQSPNLMIQIRHLDGASARIPAGATPIGDRRNGGYLLYALGVPMGPHSPQSIAAHGEGILDALEPWIHARAPLNWIGEASITAEQIRGVYDDASFERLIRVKKQVDPDNRFDKAGVGIWMAAQPG